MAVPRDMIPVVVYALPCLAPAFSGAHHRFRHSAATAPNSARCRKSLNLPSGVANRMALVPNRSPKGKNWDVNIHLHCLMRISDPFKHSTLVRQLKESCVLQPGTFSASSVYRLLVREGLDRPRLIAEGSGPTKAFETELANALWMADVMDGPILRIEDRVVHTFLFALLDDCSRLVPHGQYYDNQKLGPLLDCLKEAFRRRGLPEKLYTDQYVALQGSILPSADRLRRSAPQKKVLMLHGDRLAIPAVKTTDQGLMAALSRAQPQQMQAGKINRTQYDAAYGAQLTDDAVQAMSPPQ
jgi:hypothetical protein